MAGRLGQWVARKLDVPIVTSFHTDFGRYMSSYGVPRLQGMMTRYLTRFHRRADRTLTPSMATRADLLERGIDRAVVWGCGVDSARFHPAKRSTEMRWSLAGDDAFTFLHVGRLAPEKSVDRILAAFARCRARLDMPVKLIVAGDGPSRAGMMRSAPPGVIFLGYLDRTKDLPALYASADAFVFASETETLGLVVLEAMASGLPVVAAPAGGVADHLRHRINGLAYRPGDVDQMADYMVEIATRSGLRRGLAEGARQTALGLTWDHEFDRLDANYREVLRLAPTPTRAVPEPDWVESPT
jgi:glycosyltransferase involved in cell wall biosynthesis